MCNDSMKIILRIMTYKCDICMCNLYLYDSILCKTACLNCRGSNTITECEHRESAYKKIKISQGQCIASRPCQSIAENKLIVCRTTGRPLIFPNVIEGVCVLFENPGKKKKKYRTTRETEDEEGVVVENE